VAAAEVLYLCGLVAFTLFPLPDETAAFCAGRTTADFLNLDPLHDLVATPAGVAQLLLNVALFVPLGVLLRYRFRRGLLAAAGIGLAVSLAVEVTQGTAVFGLFGCPYRVADTGDLITNTAGAVAGWLLTLGRTAPEPQPSPDLDRPGLARRALAVPVVLTLAGFDEVDGALLMAINLIAYAISTLAVPLARGDHATLGQATLFLAPDSRAAVRPRFLAWWLPVALLQATGHLNVVAGAALVIGVLARLRPDRRSVLELLSRTTTMTRAAIARSRPAGSPPPR
jgi:hypothetical protein